MYSRNQEKILIVRMDRVGDALVTTPAVRALRKLFPHARIDFLAHSFNKIAVERNPYIDTLYVYPTNLWGIISLLCTLRKNQYDAILVMNAHSKRTSYFVSLLGAKEVWGFPRKRTKFCYTHTPECIIPQCFVDSDIQKGGGQYHIIIELLALVEGFAQSRATSLSHSISETYTKENMLQMDFILEESSSSISMRYPSNEKKRIALCIGNAKKIHTRWALDNFIMLSKRLLKEHNNIEVFICIGKFEEEMLQKHPSSFPKECILFRGSLSDTGALLQTVDSFVTSSTSYMHLAGALDIPTISLLGGYNYTVWRLLGNQHRYILSDSSGVDVQSISVDEVYEAICEQCGLVERSRENMI